MGKSLTSLLKANLPSIHEVDCGLCKELRTVKSYGSLRLLSRAQE